VLGGLLGAIIWDLVTWWLGLPTSSSTRADRRLRGRRRWRKAGFRSDHRRSGWTKTLDLLSSGRAGDGLTLALLITVGALLDPASIAAPQGR